MIRLEKYKGAKTRYTCPACNSKGEFTRFVDDGGNYLPDNVGICNRASKCGYRYTAKQFFADNPEATIGLKFSKGKKQRRVNYGFADKTFSKATQTPRTAFDVIPFEHLNATLGNYENNAFVQFLIELFPDCIKEIKAALEMYFIGSTKLGKTVFWQIDQNNRIRTGKIIAYDSASGKRRKDVNINWIHSELKRLGKLEKDFNLMQCYFGQHLLLENPAKLIALVESEKSAIVGNLCFPEWLWLATGSKQNLTIERLQRLGTRPIILFPDADGYNAWQQIGAQARQHGLNVSVSDWIETEATDEQKTEGFDIADYLELQQRGIKQTNAFFDSYNSKLAHVLEDESLFADFNSILDEQKAILVYNGLSEIEAETQITKLENLRNIVIGV
jgi:hypothetical protein